MDKIKIGDYQPCPFCGTPNDIELSRVDIQDREGFPVAMSCATCGCVGPWDYCPVSDENYWLATAVHKWNQQAALNELAQLRTERDALKARVEEFGLAVKAYKEKHQGCHTMEFSPCATCDFIDAVQEWVDDTKNTTPGGDE